MPETWWEYVQRMTKGLSQKDIAEAAGVDGSAMSRWKQGGRPGAEAVIKFARSQNRPPVEALIAAGYLNTTEIDGVVEIAPSSTEMSTDDLLVDMERYISEIRKRAATSRGAVARPDEVQDHGVPGGLLPDGYEAGMGGQPGDDSRDELGGR